MTVARSVRRFGACWWAVVVLLAACTGTDSDGDAAAVETVAPVEDAFPEVARPVELLHPCARQNSGSTLIDGLWDGDVFPALTLLRQLAVDSDAGSATDAAANYLARRVDIAGWELEQVGTDGTIRVVLAVDPARSVSSTVVLEDVPEGWAVLGVAMGEMTLSGVVLDNQAVRGRLGARSDLTIEAGLALTADDEVFEVREAVEVEGVFALPTSRQQVILRVTARQGGEVAGFSEFAVTPRPPCHFVAVAGGPDVSAAVLRSAVREAGLGGVVVLDRQAADAVATRFADRLRDRPTGATVAVGAIASDEQLDQALDALDAESSVFGRYVLDLDGGLVETVAPDSWRIERRVELGASAAEPAPTVCVAPPDFAVARSFEFRPVGPVAAAPTVADALSHLGVESQVAPSLGASLVRFDLGDTVDDADAPVGAVAWIADGSFGEFRTSVVRFERGEAGWLATGWLTAAC